MAMLRAADLTERIRVEAPISTEDELGAETQVWEEAATVWARVIETPGREFLKGDFRSEEKAVFVIRWKAIDSTWRAVWGGRIWRIVSVTGTFLEGATWLHCVSTDGVN